MRKLPARRKPGAQRSSQDCLLYEAIEYSFRNIRFRNNNFATTISQQTIRSNSQEGAQMKHFSKVVLSMMVVGFLLTVAAPRSSAQDSSAAPQPDNTKMNSQDRNQAQPTADQQKENRPDREITRDIRRSLAQDPALSTYAHNVKIITQNGMVTLKGPVRSEDEKNAIEAKAAEVAGKDKVTSQLEVKPKQ
jgi:hyperosmotically inducible periplasmic protein